MNRAERSTAAQKSDFGLFQTTIMLEEQVRQRTMELEETLCENERITRSLRESEATFRGVVNQSLIGIAISDGIPSPTPTRSSAKSLATRPTRCASCARSTSQ
jgi:hypothetical protein